MKPSTIIPTSAAIGLVLTAGLALAQGTSGPMPSSGNGQQMQQGGMDGMNMGGGKQGGMGMMGMGGMGPQQGGGMSGGGMSGGGMGGCGMMGMGGMGQQQAGGTGSVAALQERLNQLEQRLNAVQAQPSTPAKPQ